MQRNGLNHWQVCTLMLQSQFLISFYSLLSWQSLWDGKVQVWLSDGILFRESSLGWCHHLSENWPQWSKRLKVNIEASILTCWITQKKLPSTMEVLGRRRELMTNFMTWSTTSSMFFIRDSSWVFLTLCWSSTAQSWLDTPSSVYQSLAQEEKNILKASIMTQPKSPRIMSETHPFWSTSPRPSVE